MHSLVYGLQQVRDSLGLMAMERELAAQLDTVIELPFSSPVTIYVKSFLHDYCLGIKMINS